MRHSAEDLVDVVEVDGVPVGVRPSPGAKDPSPRPDQDSADVYFGRGPLAALVYRCEWWRRASGGDRQLAGVAAVLVILGLVAATAAIVRTNPVQHRVDVVMQPAGPAGVDAAGCPLSRVCATRATPDLAAVVHRLVPLVPVVTATEVYDVTYGTVYRRDVFARSTALSATIWVHAQCLPTSAPPTDQAPDASWDYYTGTDGVRYESVERTRISAVSGCVAYARAAFPLVYEQTLTQVNGDLLGIIYSPQSLAGL